MFNTGDHGIQEKDKLMVQDLQANPDGYCSCIA